MGKLHFYPSDFPKQPVKTPKTVYNDVPGARIYENDGEYTVTVDLPGIDRATLDISVDDNRLTIKGNRAGQDTTRHRAECPRGKFLKTFSVPAAVDQNDIKAEYKDGVLQVHLPKCPERKAQRVEIKVS